LENQLLYEFGLLGNCRSLTFMDLEPEPEPPRAAPAPAPGKKGGSGSATLHFSDNYCTGTVAIPVPVPAPHPNTNQRITYQCTFYFGFLNYQVPVSYDMKKFLAALLIVFYKHLQHKTEKDKCAFISINVKKSSSTQTKTENQR